MGGGFELKHLAQGQLILDACSVKHGRSSPKGGDIDGLAECQLEAVSRRGGFPYSQTPTDLAPLQTAYLSLGDISGVKPHHNDLGWGRGKETKEH